MKKRNHLCTGASLAALLVSTPAVLAQDAAPRPSGLEDIVVTARKTEEKLSDAPVAVSVSTAETIDAQGIRDINDLARLSTGLSFSQTFGRSTERPVIRGQSNVLAGVQFGAESGVSYFIDGIYYPGDIQSFDLDTLQRVEIIKGPQSALYGRNTYSGAINYITRDPGTEFQVRGKALVAEHNEYEARLSVSGPIAGDRLGFSAGGRYFKYGGEYRNQLTGNKVGQEETKSGYLALVAEPLEDFKIKFRGQYNVDDDGVLPLFLQGAGENNCFPGFRSPRYRQASVVLPFWQATLRSDNDNQFFCGEIKPKPGGIRLNTDPLTVLVGSRGNPTGVVRDGTVFDGIEVKQWIFTNSADWDIAGSGWTLHSGTGYRTRDRWFGADSDHSEAFIYTTFAPPPAVPAVPTTEPLFGNTTTSETRDFSQEFRISSPSGERIRALAGVYYFNQKVEERELTATNPRAGDPAGQPGSAELRTKNKAAFGSLAFDVLENLTVTGEIRYAEETKQRIEPGFRAGLAGLAGTYGAVTPIAAASSFDGYKSTSWTPRFTVDFKPTDSTLIYAVYAKGVKPGGVNGASGAPVTVTSPCLSSTAARGTGVFYCDEISKSIELGIKTSGLDNRVRIDANVFRMKTSNVQLTTAIPSTTAVNSIVTNQGDARTTGLELQVQARPVDELTLSLGYAYVNAKFTRGCDPDVYVLRSGGLLYDPDLGRDNPLCSIKGNKLPLGSPHILNGSAAWERDVGGGNKFFITSNFSFEDSKFVQVDNLAKTGDAFLLNARFGVKSSRWSIAAFGRNLTNEDSILLATRWFDLRYGSGSRDIPVNLTTSTTAVPPRPGVQAAGLQSVADTGTPRAFFGTLRRGRTFGVEGSFSF
jgi:outer membrane receptor protein involved in Fe transport